MIPVGSQADEGFFMAEATSDLRKYIEQIPSSDEIRRRLDQTAEESKLLRRLLRLAVQREKVEEVSTK